jgi:hypothetical protein
MAQRRGDAVAAETRYRRALAMSPRDSYLQGAYADFLLDQRRPAEVLVLLKDQMRIDALLLRRALALQQQGRSNCWRPTSRNWRPASTPPCSAATPSISASRRALNCMLRKRSCKTALALARKNWAVQKESADMRIYARSRAASAR